MKRKVLNHNLLSLWAWQTSSAIFLWAGGCFCALWLRIPSLKTSFPENLLTLRHVFLLWLVVLMIITWDLSLTPRIQHSPSCSCYWGRSSHTGRQIKQDSRKPYISSLSSVWPTYGPLLTPTNVGCSSWFYAATCILRYESGTTNPAPPPAPHLTM